MVERTVSDLTKPLLMYLFMKKKLSAPFISNCDHSTKKVVLSLQATVIIK